MLTKKRLKDKDFKILLNDRLFQWIEIFILIKFLLLFKVI